MLPPRSIDVISLLCVKSPFVIGNRVAFSAHTFGVQEEVSEHTHFVFLVTVSGTSVYINKPW